MDETPLSCGINNITYDRSTKQNYQYYEMRLFDHCSNMKYTYIRTIRFVILTLKCEYAFVKLFIISITYLRVKVCELIFYYRK